MRTSTGLLAGCGLAALALTATAALAQDERPEDIVVEAQRLNQSQVLREGNLGALGNKSAMDVPFAIKAYDSTLILNQQPQTLGQVLENDPSVRTTYGFGNASEQFVIRGFPLFSDDIAIDGLYGITPRQLVSPELYDQVQLLSGASAFLFGAAPGGTAIGGTVNLIPKRAGRSLMRVTGNYTSTGHFGGAFDAARRFGAGEQFGIRVNGAGRWGDIAINDEYRSSIVIGAGTDWRSADGSVRVSLDLAYQRAKVRNMRPMVQVFDFTALPRAPKSDINYGQPWQYTTLRDVFGVFKGEWDVAEGFTLYGSVGARDGAERGDYQNYAVIDSATGASTVYGARIPRNDNNEAGQLGVRAKADWSGVTQEINVGVSAIRQVNRNAFAFSDFINPAATNLYDPVDVPAPAFDFFTSGNLADPGKVSGVRLFSMFASDTIGVLDDRVQAIVGLRRQKMRILSYTSAGAATVAYDKEATTPVFGLVLKPNEHVSLYANRIQGLAQGPTAPALTVNAGQIFPPFKSTQYEVGGKVAFGGWNASLALFKTSQPNGITRPVDPANPAGAQIFALEGQQRNRGIEFSFDGQPVEGLRIIAGATLLDASLRRTQNGLFDGNDAPGVPDFTANANVEWDVPFVPGITLTGRVVYTDRQYFDQANTLSIPSWTRFDLGGRYVFAAGGVPLTLRVNVDNVADDNYWASAFGSFGGQLVQGLPRTVKASVTADF